MKKVLYSLALVLLGLSSCTTWDEPKEENYGAGPAISVTLTAGTPTDSSFVLNIVPAEGTGFYAFVIDVNDEDQSASLDAETLLEGKYGGNVLNAATMASVNVTYGAAQGVTPNTTYQVYAVAANEQGVVGQIAHASITTTDNNAPRPRTYSVAGAANKQATVTFSENILRGEGAVNVVYYKEWDITNPVAIPEDEVEVSVSGAVATFSVPTAPAGAYVAVSFAAGAFVDAVGNAAPGLNSGLNMTTGRFTNVTFRVPTEAWEIADSTLTSPVDNFLFGSVDEFNGEFTFAEPIFRNDQTVKTGDLSVTYKGDDHEATYKLAADDWAVDGNKLTFVLPAAPAPGDFVTVTVAEGAVTDVLGNPNAEYTSKLSWQLFVPKKENVLGTFAVTYLSASKKAIANAGTVTIEEDPEVENGVIIKDFLLSGSELTGYYDLSKALLYINDFQVLGPATFSGGQVYQLVFVNADNETDEDIPVTFKINSDGTLTQVGDYWGIYCYSEDFTTPVGWYDYTPETTFTPATAATARKKSASSFKAAKALSGKAAPAKKFLSK